MTTPLHFLDIVNQAPQWNLFSTTQNGYIIPDTLSLLAVGQEEVIAISSHQAQAIVTAVCQTVATPHNPFILVDLDDMKNIMSQDGHIWVSEFTAVGKNRVENVVRGAIYRSIMPTFTQAQKILCYVYGNESIGLGEYEMVRDLVTQSFNDAEVVRIGLVFDHELKEDEIHIKLMAFGCK